MSEYAAARDECIAEAERAKQRAKDRFNQITRNAEASIRQRDRRFNLLTPREQAARIRDVAAELRKKDEVWKGHVSDNQWYMQQAIMYGTAANGELLKEIRDRLPEPRSGQIFSSYIP